MELPDFIDKGKILKSIRVEDEWQFKAVSIQNFLDELKTGNFILLGETHFVPRIVWSVFRIIDEITQFKQYDYFMEMLRENMTFSEYIEGLKKSLIHSIIFYKKIAERMKSAENGEEELPDDILKIDKEAIQGREASLEGKILYIKGVQRIEEIIVSRKLKTFGFYPPQLLSGYIDDDKHNEVYYENILKKYSGNDSIVHVGAAHLDYLTAVLGWGFPEKKCIVVVLNRDEEDLKKSHTFPFSKVNYVVLGKLIDYEQYFNKKEIEEWEEQAKQFE